MGSVQRPESLIMVVITEDRAMHEIITHSCKSQTILYSFQIASLLGKSHCFQNKNTIHYIKEYFMKIAFQVNYITSLNYNY